MTTVRGLPRCGALAAALLFLVLFFAWTPGARAQALNMSGGPKDTPIEITADNGIEWQQDNKVFLAKGNAKAVRGNITVYADQLTAFYTEQADGKTDIYRMDADGHVRIKSTNQTARGDKAVYDVVREILVLTGHKPNLVAPGTTITASRQLEYWQAKQMAVARGDAVATKDNREVKADVLAAYFHDIKGETKVYRVDAFDRVAVLTDRDRAFGDRGVYNVESGIATLTGSVRIERGKNQLFGCRARVNLNSGISRLFSCPGGRTEGRLIPNTKEKNKKAAKKNSTQDGTAK